MTTNNTLSLIVRDTDGVDVAAVAWTDDAERLASVYGAGTTVRYHTGELLWTVPAEWETGDGSAAITFAIVALASKAAETAAAIADVEKMMREQFPTPAGPDVRNRGDRAKVGFCVHGVDLRFSCTDCAEKHGTRDTYDLRTVAIVDADDTEPMTLEESDALAESIAPRQNEPEIEDPSKYATAEEYHTGVFGARPPDDYDYLDVDDAVFAAERYGTPIPGETFAGADVLEGADGAEFGPKI